MEKRTSPVVCLALTALLCPLTAVRADIPQLEENPSAQPESELLLTNTTDLVGLYLEGYNYPIGSWVWAPGTFFPVQFQPMTIVWANTANLPTGLAGITNSAPTSLESVNAWPLWVTLWPQSNTVTVLQPWSDETLTEFTVPDWFPSWQVYEANLYPSCVLFGINYTNWETLVEEGYTQFSVPQVITHAWLMDVGSRDTYWNNLEAQCAAAEAATASAASMSRGFMAMDDDGGGGSDPCTLTNLLQAFYVTNVRTERERVYHDHLAVLPVLPGIIYLRKVASRIRAGRLHLEVEQGGEVLVVPAGGLLFGADAEFDSLVAAQLVQA